MLERVFSELGLPGAELVNGLGRSIFHPTRPPQLQYSATSGKRNSKYEFIVIVAYLYT